MELVSQVLKQIDRLKSRNTNNELSDISLIEKKNNYIEGYSII